MSFSVVGAHNQQVFLHVQMRKKINKNIKGPRSGTISMVLSLWIRLLTSSGLAEEKGSLPNFVYIFGRVARRCC